MPGQASATSCRSSPTPPARGTVVTIAATEDIEAVGVNTPDDLALVEAHLLAR